LNLASLPWSRHGPGAVVVRPGTALAVCCWKTPSRSATPKLTKSRT